MDSRNMTNDDVRWYGYDPADIYSAQDTCLRAIEEGRPVPYAELQRIPPLRAGMIIKIARRAMCVLERGTWDQALDEVMIQGETGKLRDWWGPRTSEELEVLQYVREMHNQYREI